MPPHKWFPSGSPSGSFSGQSQRWFPVPLPSGTGTTATGSRQWFPRPSPTTTNPMERTTAMTNPTPCTNLDQDDPTSTANANVPAGEVARVGAADALEAPGDGATAPDAAERAQRYAEALGKAACRALGSCGDFHRHEEAFTRAVMAVADQETAELRAEVERLREGLREIAADHERQTRTWHDRSFPTKAAGEWHDGYVTACASHSIKAKKFYDPEGSAEDDRLWKVGCNGSDLDWYQETGHCGHCGVVASNCQCTPEDPCECFEAHGPRKEPWVPPEARADAAEAESARLASAVAKVEALADEWAEAAADGRLNSTIAETVRLRHSWSELAENYDYFERALRAALASVAPDTATPGERPRRFDQCDDTCTTDCGHCKGKGRAASSADDKAGESGE